MSCYRCPRCHGSRLRLIIDQYIEIDCHHDEPIVVERPFGDVRWTDHSPARCESCGYTAELLAFSGESAYRSPL